MPVKILVAEDDRHTRRILEHIFTKDPHFAGKDVEILAAADGEEALRFFEREKPDLVISDLLMPKLDGFALCRAIRKLPFGKDVPIIVTSAIYKETALLGRMRQELNVEFLAKPFQVRELVTTVLRMLEKRGALAPGPEEGARPEPRRAIGEDAPAEGALSDRRLGALIFDALETNATGQLSLRRGKIRKEIFFVLGSPVAADSNVRAESLAQYLLLKRVLDEAQVSRLLAAAQRERQSVLQTLAALGWLNEEEILRHYTAIVKVRIINALRWGEGTYRFDPGDSFSDRVLRCTIDGAKLALLGLKRMLSAEDASRELEGHRDRVLRLTTRARRFGHLFERVFGREMLDLLEPGRTLNELLAMGLDSLMVYVHSYALTSTDMAQFGEERASRAEVPSAGDPLDLEQLKRASGERALKASSTEDVVHRELFGVDEISVVANLGDPGTEEEHSETSQVVEIPISVELEPSAGGRSPEALRRKVLQTYLGLHDKNYYELLGVSPQASKEEIERAYHRLVAEFDPAKYSQVDLGTDHPKLEEVVSRFRQAYQVLADPELRKDYDRRLAQASGFRADPLEGELRFREGEVHLKEGRCREAVESFRQATLVDPDVADYHAYLAWAKFCGASDKSALVQETKQALEKVLQMDPDSVAAHYFLGRLHGETGSQAEALRHLERVLDMDPEHEEAFEFAYRLLADAGDWDRLERLHRKIIQRLESKASPKSLEFWKRLGKLYAERLNSPEKARTCFERALELHPEDEEARRLLESLSRQALPWSVTLQRLLDAWASEPGKVSVLQELFEEATKGEHWEEAFLLASALEGLGGAHAPAQAFYRRYRPRFLVRAGRTLEDADWEVLRHPNDDPAVAEVFGLLEGAEGVIGYSATLPRVSEATGPEAEAHLLRVWRYAGQFFGFREVRVWAGDVDMPVPKSVFSRHLVVPHRLVGERDHVRLAAQVGYGFGLVRRGRSLVAHLHSRQGKDLVTAIMVMLVPKLQVPDPQGSIRALASRLARLDPGVRDRLRSAMAALTKQKKSLSISRYYRGVQATCGRMAFILCGDLAPVVAIMASRASQESLTDTVRFALSEAGLTLRDQLGLSLVV